MINVEIPKAFGVPELCPLCDIDLVGYAAIGGQVDVEFRRPCTKS